jgi:anaerobic selenocysteine-containing dehydrogenase
MSEQIFTSCTVGGPVFVHVKDGRIVRVRPIRLDANDAEACPYGKEPGLFRRPGGLSEEENRF